MNDISEKNGFKVGTTAIIWGFATAMMALSIPLVAISHSGAVLPLAVILGTSVSTVAIWRSDNKKSVESFKDFQQLEQRVRDLETICSSEDFDTIKQFKQLDKKNQN